MIFLVPAIILAGQLSSRVTQGIRVPDVRCGWSIVKNVHLNIGDLINAVVNRLRGRARFVELNRGSTDDVCIGILVIRSWRDHLVPSASL